MNRRLVHELAQAGGNWVVTAVAPDHFRASNDLRPITFEREPNEPCEVVPIRAYGTRRAHVFAYGPELRDILRRGWDLVHCWEEPFVVAGAQTAFLTPPGTPLVFATAQNLSKRYPPPFGALERYTVARSAGWVSMGRLIQENLQSRPGYGGIPVVQIPLGTDVERFRADPASRERVRRDLGWDSPGPPVVGFLGRFVPEKGLSVLTAALDGVDIPWRALVVGAGPLEASLRAWSARHGDRVRICTGIAHEQVPAYLGAMDIVCAPSQTVPAWKEQFGRMLIEAFAAGRPVVASDSGEIPYVVKDSGIIVQEADVPAWSRAIADLLQNDAKRAELGARGVARAHGEFAWPVVARSYLRFFESLVEGR
jgi:glycosyltransferase involved in cell wall biosynthesis